MSEERANGDNLHCLVGRRFRRLGRVCRVMAVTEGYVVARFKGDLPFIMNGKQFKREYYDVTPNDQANASERSGDSVECLVGGENEA